MLLKTKQLMCAATVALFTLSPAAYAARDNVITVPSCLLTASGAHGELLAFNEGLMLVKVDEEAMEALNDTKHKTKTPCGGFRNVTADWQQYQHNSLVKKNNTAFLNKYTHSAKKSHLANKTYSIRYQKQANELISQINPGLMWDSLKKFSSSKDRHSNSDEGVAAASWIKSQIEGMAKSAGRTDVTVTFIKTTGYKQPSVVAKLGTSNEAGVVIGAHMDTTSGRFERKPGADDDGSGSMTVMESARTIIASGVKFKKPVYFIWYAAEEAGLVGSQDVVAEFTEKKISVDAVMHFDMTGYAYRKESTIWLIDDNVDSGLTKFLEKIVTTYTNQPVAYTRCGYACSDHASWSEAGYTAAMPAESRYEDTNPTLHSSRDTIDNLDKNHMTDYAKIATAFAVELAEPVI